MSTDGHQGTPIGQCACGCGRLTPLARYNDRRFGHVKGEHFRFCIGHAGGAGQKPDVLAEYVPTLAEIVAACAIVRRGWTSTTRRQRGSSWTQKLWRPPVLPCR